VRPSALAALAAAAALVASVVPAEAASTVAREPLRRGSPTLAVAPVFAGTRVVWGEQSAKTTIVREAGGGRPLQFTARVRSRDGTVATLEALSGSASQLAIGRAVHAAEDPSVVVRTLDGGTLRGPFRALVAPRFYYSGEGCINGALGGAPSFATSGTMLAWVEVRCDQSPDPVKLVVQATPGRAARTLATGEVGGLGPVRLAGRVIAYRATPAGASTAAIVVRDAGSGNERYIADPAPALASGGTLTDFAVGADGRVIATVDSGPDAPPRLIVFAQGGAQPRELMLGAPRGTSYGPPVLVGGEVAVDVRSRAGIRQLLVARLDGRVLARVTPRGKNLLTAGTSGGPALDFDGRRLTYATQRLPAGHRSGELRMLVQST
jgi:hypothetical protein